VVNAISFDGAISVVDGSTGSTTFSAPTTDVDTSSGLSQACGSFTYEVFADESDTALSTAWATVEIVDGATYRLKVDTSVDTTLIDGQASVDIDLWVKSSLQSNTDRVKRNMITITITETACDCELLLWNAPV
jgi:hypothetical protein